MSPPIHRVGRLTLAELQRRKLYMSYLVCRDDRNQPIIVATRSPYLFTYNQPYLQVTKEEKVNMMKATIKAHQRGEMMPRQSDLVRQVTVRLKVIDPFGLERKPLEVYELRI